MRMKGCVRLFDQALSLPGYHYFNVSCLAWHSPVILVTDIIPFCATGGEVIAERRHLQNMFRLRST